MERAKENIRASYICFEVWISSGSGRSSVSVESFAVSSLASPSGLELEEDQHADRMMQAATAERCIGSRKERARVFMRELRGSRFRRKSFIGVVG